MGMLVNFSAELRDWIMHNLERGCAPTDVVTSMISQRFEPALAVALVNAFVEARTKGAAIPQNAINLELETEEYQYESPRIASGAIIHTSDRSIPVLVRATQPVLVVLENVLSAEECVQLIELARGRLTSSTVVDPATGDNLAKEYRDSQGMFFQLEENAFIARIDRRLSEIMNCPIENGEGLQVLRYGRGGKNEPHFDFLIPSNDFNKTSLTRSGQRISTLVIYLNDVEAGGETYFPEIGFSVTPKQGNAVYFEYANSLGQVDSKSLHASAAITRGEKWAATKWVRERRFIPAYQ